MRIRVTSAAYGMSVSTPNGFYENGEVEDYAIVVASVLPDEDVLLQVKKENNKEASVSWQPVSEISFTGYELQQSADGNNWQTIYTTSVNPLNNLRYNYADVNPSAPFSYYRVKILKTSGAFLYTDIKRLDFTGKVSVSINPNPAKNRAVLMVQSELAGNANMDIVDYSGRVVYQQNMAVIKGENQIPVSAVQKLSPGLYKVRVLINGEMLSTTLVVMQ